DSGRRMQHAVVGNQLLSSFESASQAQINRHIERFEVKAGQVVSRAGDSIDHVYFPDGAILSVLTLLANGSAIETANIGREGAFGLFEAMYTHHSFSECLVVMPGGLLRIPFKILRHFFENSSCVRSLFIVYNLALRSQIEQAVACYATHTTQQRICRWLLSLHDRNGGHDLP